MAAGHMDPAGQGATNAGKLCGMLGVALTILAGSVWIAMAALGTAVSSMQ